MLSTVGTVILWQQAMYLYWISGGGEYLKLETRESSLDIFTSNILLKITEADLDHLFH